MPGKNGHHPVEVIAEVQAMELDLERNGSYRLLLKDGATVRADFTAAQWGHLEGMHNHGRYSVKIVGEGDYADGRLERIVSIDLKRTERVLPPEDPELPTVWHRIAEISKSVDWSDAPTDGAKNLRHYLYGHARVDD